MDVSATWKGGMSFVGRAPSGFSVKLDASPIVGGNDDGFRPMELMALGLASCTGMDVISILRKKRQEVTDFEVRVNTKNADKHPHVWVQVDIDYLITGHNLDPRAVERAIELSSARYCPAQNMIAQATEIKTAYQIIEAETA